VVNFVQNARSTSCKRGGQLWIETTTEGEYEAYRGRQDAEYLSDFDRVVEEARRLEGKQEPKALGPGTGAKGKKRKP
jgi:hypothetical protein